MNRLTLVDRHFHGPDNKMIKQCYRKEEEFDWQFDAD